MADGTTPAGTFAEIGDDQHTVCTGNVSVTTHDKNYYQLTSYMSR